MTRNMRYKFLYIMLICVALTACSESKDSEKIVKEEIQADEMPDQVAYDVKVDFMDSTFLKAKLKANRARIYTEKKKTYLDGDMTAEFLSIYNGARVSILTADSAEIDDNTQDMVARGNVIVYSDSTDTKMETSVLFWDNKTRLFHSPEFVKVTSPHEVMRGYGFESDQNLKYYKFYKVSGERK